MKLLYQTWQANDLTDWCVASAILICVMSVRSGLRYGLGRIASAATETTALGIAEDLLDALKLWLVLPLAAFAAASALEIPEKIEQYFNTLAIAGLLLQAAFWMNVLVERWVARQIGRRHSTDGDAITVLRLLGFCMRLLVWTLVLLSILKHLHFDVTALLTGLGIGGVAVALAVQNVLSDLFASLSIVLDKPFVVGDFIVVDDCLGTVEHIGLKTTKVRSLSGELIVCPNAELLRCRIHNYKHLYERRVVFALGVTYQTPVQKLEMIPAILREAVESQRSARFDRAHLKECGPCSLVFEIVYFVQSADFNLYMDIQQAINFLVLRRFSREGIEIAHPATAIVMKRAEPALRSALALVSRETNDGNTY